MNSSSSRIGSKWKHAKRGTVYEVIAHAELQMSADLVDGTELVVYRGEDGRLWAREEEEFLDGRFTELTAARIEPRTDATAMRSILDDVAAFHAAAGTEIPSQPGIPSLRVKERRIRLIEEEVVKETLCALRNDDLVGIADGVVDSIYVLVGAALDYGLPLEALWACVQAANMAKFAEGWWVREDGKVMKPPGWQPPAISRILVEAKWEVKHTNTVDDLSFPQRTK